MVSPPRIPAGLSLSPKNTAEVAAAHNGSVLSRGGGRKADRQASVTSRSSLHLSSAGRWPTHPSANQLTSTLPVSVIADSKAHLKMTEVSVADTKARAMDSKTTARAEVTTPVYT